MVYVVDTSTATEDSLGTVLSGHQGRYTADIAQARFAREGKTTTKQYGIGKHWKVGKPAPRAEYEAWKKQFQAEDDGHA